MNNQQLRDEADSLVAKCNLPELLANYPNWLSAKKSRFTNNVGDDPNGLYWGIKLGDERKGAWKIDLWFLDTQDYERHSKYCDSLRSRLTTETRTAVLDIKEAYWRRREYRDTITSDLSTARFSITM